MGWGSFGWADLVINYFIHLLSIKHSVGLFCTIVKSICTNGVLGFFLKLICNSDVLVMSLLGYIYTLRGLFVFGCCV